MPRPAGRERAGETSSHGRTRARRRRRHRAAQHRSPLSVRKAGAQSYRRRPRRPRRPGRPARRRGRLAGRRHRRGLSRRRWRWWWRRRVRIDHFDRPAHQRRMHVAVESVGPRHVEAATAAPTRRARVRGQRRHRPAVGARGLRARRRRRVGEVGVVFEGPGRIRERDRAADRDRDARRAPAGDVPRIVPRDEARARRRRVAGGERRQRDRGAGAARQREQDGGQTTTQATDHGALPLRRRVTRTDTACGGVLPPTGRSSELRRLQ